MTADLSYLNKERIREVLAVLARGVDRVDAELIASCYWPDSTDDHGSFVGTGREFADRPERRSPSNVASQHLLGQSVIVLNDDKAFSETYFTYIGVTRYEAGGDMWVQVHGRYVDELECREGVWKVRHRKVIHDLSREEPAGTAFADSVNYPVGSRYPEDLSYRLPGFGSKAAS